MSTTPVSRSPATLAPATLAEVITLITGRTDLPLRRRQDLASAVRVVCRTLGLPPESVAAEPEALRARLAPLTAGAAGMASGRWRNVRSLFTQALTLTGITATGRRSRASMAPAWRTLLGRIADRYERSRLSRLARYCTARAIPPEQVDDTVVDAFGAMLLQQSLVERPKQVHRETCLAWNRCVDAVAGWPPGCLAVPSNRRDYALPLAAFPESFAADCHAFLDHLAGLDLFSETARTPASPVTLRNRRLQLLQLATALVQSGRDPASIRSLADLVEVEAAKQMLMFFWSRNGNRKTGQIHNFSLLLVNLAKHWVKVPPAQLEALRELRRRIDPGKGGMTERNRSRLRVFDDPVNIERLVNLPFKLAQTIGRHAQPSYGEAIQVQSAVAIAIQLVAPLRAKNLAGLRLDRHLVRTRPGPHAVMHLVIPQNEVKNKAPLEFELPPEVVRLLELYLGRFRSLLMSGTSDFLFPARSGGAKTPAQLAAQVQRTIAKATGFNVNIHLFRHLCAFLFLRAHPGEYETVRLLLGHKSLTTTVRSYCGLEQSDAFRRYDSLIDRYRQPQELHHPG